MFEQLGVIGCGLMGGSFALALKQAGLVKRIVGYSKSPTTTERARQMGIIDVAAPSALLAVSGADLVLIAVPVASSEATFKSIKHLLTPTTLIMDVGSTKKSVIEAAHSTLGEHLGTFVPAHPITGKEVSGVEHAIADLYAGKQVILTPTRHTLPAQVKKAVALWTALGCSVRQMTPEAHDAAFAAVSHLPHLLAFTLISSISSQQQGREFLSLGGPGFRDFTRIAASDPQMWRDIMMTNRTELLTQIDMFKRTLTTLESMISSGNGDSLEGVLKLASQARARWHMTSHKSAK